MIRSRLDEAAHRYIAELVADLTGGDTVTHIATPTNGGADLIVTETGRVYRLTIELLEVNP